MTAQNLQQHQWKERVVVVTSETFDHADAQAQIEAFRVSKAELVDRAMVVYHLTPEGFRFQFEDAVNPNSKEDGEFDFRVVLIGLDGTRKYESRTFEPAQVYYGLIDRMPMRRSQMRKRVKNGG